MSGVCNVGPHFFALFRARRCFDCQDRFNINEQLGGSSPNFYQSIYVALREEDDLVAGNSFAVKPDRRSTVIVLNLFQSQTECSDIHACLPLIDKRHPFFQFRKFPGLMPCGKVLGGGTTPYSATRPRMCLL
jgi:hypothetical protein